MLNNKNIVRQFSVKSDITTSDKINSIILSISNSDSFKIALTHKSYLEIDKSVKTYERLEFLGDAVLQIYVTLFLYYFYPNSSEGKLTNLRTTLVEGKYLSSLSLKIGLYNHLKLGKDKANINFNNESLSKKDSKILTDIFESFIAALLLEKGCKILFEFLSLTVLDKPEFKGKLDSFNLLIEKLIHINNSELILLSNKDKQNINPNLKDNKSNKEDNINVNKALLATEASILNKESKLIELMDKSLINQNYIIEILIKIFVLMEYTLKKSNSPLRIILLSKT